MHMTPSAQSRAKRAVIREIPLLCSGSPQDGNTVNLRYKTLQTNIVFKTLKLEVFVLRLLLALHQVKVELVMTASARDK